MSTMTGAGDRPAHDLSTEIRGELRHIESLDESSNGYLTTLAFVLHRIALADNQISDHEVARMESILVEHAALSRSEAVLTVAMAKQRCRAADCGHAYDASRRLRTMLTPEQRGRVVEFLDAVASADGLVRATEQAAVRQIAAELGTCRE